MFQYLSLPIIHQYYLSNLYRRKIKTLILRLGRLTNGVNKNYSRRIVVFNIITISHQYNFGVLKVYHNKLGKNNNNNNKQRQRDRETEKQTNKQTNNEQTNKQTNKQTPQRTNTPTTQHHIKQHKQTNRQTNEHLNTNAIVLYVSYTTSNNY